MKRIILCLALLSGGCVFSQELSELPEFVPAPDMSEDLKQDTDGTEVDMDTPDATTCPDTPCSNGFECVGGECVCPEGSNVCAGNCAPESELRCGESCTACPTAEGGTALCEEGTCFLECPSGETVYQGVCLPTGGSCELNTVLDGGNRCDPVLQDCGVFQFCDVTQRQTPVECTNDGECDPGQVCDSLRDDLPLSCVRMFTQCTQRFVRPPNCSTINNPCPNGLMCMNDGLCGPCQGDQQCRSGESCVDGICRGVLVPHIGEGEACDSASANDRCREGFACHEGTCKRVCMVEAGVGCETGDACKPFQASQGIGICVPQNQCD
ncbi:hypothetical protein FRD01_10290 [Microvenator marinus]|jgi:hypothetical protein|uniref:Uncharacterized protein n=1 Tax=Microvenator marinus TaxID=2600177 RepID=A0A5B8XQN8_9DELT|nr:hypothetical protein [Microvenator marinus]QED27621.1 hypothetical protein FRD01_10290 [Microvenator marinus]